MNLLLVDLPRVFAYYAAWAGPPEVRAQEAFIRSRDVVLKQAGTASWDRVLLCVDDPAVSYRRALSATYARERDEARATWTQAIHYAYEELCCDLGERGYQFVRPRVYEPGEFIALGTDCHMLAGQTGEARDVVASILMALVGQEGRARIVSPRGCMRALTGPGVEVVRAEHGDAWHVDTAPLPVPPAVYPEYEALMALRGVGERYAQALLVGGPSTWRTAVEVHAAAVGASEHLPRGCRNALREAGELAIRVAVAVAQLRTDAVDVAAVLGGEERNDVGFLRRDGRAGQDEATGEASSGAAAIAEDTEGLPASEGRPSRDDEQAARAKDGREVSRWLEAHGARPPRADGSVPLNRNIKPEKVIHMPPNDTRTVEPEIEQPYDEPRAAAPLARREEIAIDQPRPARLRPEAPPAPRQPGPRTSDNTAALTAALALAQSEFGEVVKSRTADIQSRTRGSYSYKFANLSDVMRAIGPALRKHGLVPMQIPMGDRVYVRIVHGPSGEWIEGGLPLALPDYGSDIQRLGSALTYMRRYLLTMMLGIVADDEDDDGAAAQHPRRGAA